MWAVFLHFCRLRCHPINTNFHISTALQGMKTQMSTLVVLKKKLVKVSWNEDSWSHPSVNPRLSLKCSGVPTKHLLTVTDLNIYSVLIHPVNNLNREIPSRTTKTIISLWCRLIRVFRNNSQTHRRTELCFSRRRKWTVKFHSTNVSNDPLIDRATLSPRWFLALSKMYSTVISSTHTS